MRIKKHSTLLMLAVLLVATLATARCGAPATQAPEPTKTVVEPTKAPEPTKVAEPTKEMVEEPTDELAKLLEEATAYAAGAEGDVTVTYMSSGTYDKAAEDLAAEVMPKGLNVTVDALPWAVLAQTHTSDLISGAGQYDVTSIAGYDNAEVFEFFEPLDAYIQRDNWGQGMLEGLMYEPTGRTPFFHGKQIGIPYAFDAYGVLYRTDLLEQAGVEPEFETWVDLVEACEKLQESLDGTGIYPWVFSYGSVEQITNIFFGEYQGTYISKEGKYVLETDEAVRTFKVLKDMLPYGPPDQMALNIDEMVSIFLDGRAAMMACWPSFARAAADDPTKSEIAGKWAQMPFPGKGFVNLAQWNLSIPKTTQDKELAWSWIKAYTSEANSRYMLDKYGIGSVYESVYSDPDVIESHGHDLPVAAENLKRGHVFPLSMEALDFLARTLIEYLTGTTDAEAAVAKVNQQWATFPVVDARLELAEDAGLVEK